MTAPEHAVTVIVTTRVTSAGLLKVEPARQRRVPLAEGLGSADAQLVLRALDGDGHLGLRDASGELLDGLCRHTRGFPRALEAVKAILDGDDTLTPRDLLDHARQLPADQVVQVLVGEAYDLLDAAAQQVMQALAVCPAPVSAVGADFLLQPVNPTINAAPILTRLVRHQLARFQDGRYYLHPVDRDYARGQLPLGRPGDPAAAFTLAGLQARAADYYARIRTPRQSWRTLEDVRPQLAEFELRCDAGDYDTAATVLNDIDFRYLQMWGHYRTLLAMHGRIHGRITDPTLNTAHLTNLGLCHYRLGDYRGAIDLHTQALVIARAIGDRYGEGTALDNLGLCHYSLGDYRRAIDLHTQALAIARDTGNRYIGANAVGYLGRAWLASGNPRQAAALLGEAVSIADTTGDIEPAVEARSWLARAYLQLGESAAALAATARRDLLYPAEEPAMRLLEGLALLELDRRQESVRAFSEAVTAADTLLALADRNVTALQARALALSGLAVAAGDLARAAEASEALGVAGALADAAGVAEDTRRMLDQIARHDQSGILAKVRAAKGP